MRRKFGVLSILVLAICFLISVPSGYSASASLSSTEYKAGDTVTIEGTVSPGQDLYLAIASQSTFAPKDTSGVNEVKRLKKEAAKRLSDALGQDFTGFFKDKDNPLLPSIDVRFYAEWANNDSLLKIQDYILKNKGVKDIYYQKSLVHLINRNLRKISLVLLGFSILLLIIAVALINNTIRLSVYSRRFIIRSMQLVGATQGFIRKPFILRGLIQGVISALVALILLSAIIATLWKNLPELKLVSSPEMLIFLYLFVLILGMIVSGISTIFAVKKYLNMKVDKLYG